MVRILDILTALALIVSLSCPAHAYVSSDGGSMLLQAILGGFAGVSVLGRYLVGRLLAYLASPRG